MPSATAGRAELNLIFVRANINRVDGEFELMVARLAREKIPRSSEPFAQTLDAFLSLVFVPTYRTVLKRKGIVVPLAPKADTKRES